MGRVKELWIERQNELAEWEYQAYQDDVVVKARSEERDQLQRGPQVFRSTMRIDAEAQIVQRTPSATNVTQDRSEPPLSGEFIVRLVLPMRDREDIIGDLFENYAFATSRHGVRKARLIFWVDVASLVLPSIARHFRNLAIFGLFLRFVDWILDRSV